MKTTLFVVTIALLLSLAGNWYQWGANRDKEDKLYTNKDLNELTHAYDDEIVKRESVIKAIRNKMATDSINNLKKDSVYVAKIQRLNGKLRSIDTSKSSDKQLDSLINLLYGQK